MAELPRGLILRNYAKANSRTVSKIADAICRAWDQIPERDRATITGTSDLSFEISSITSMGGSVAYCGSCGGQIVIAESITIWRPKKIANIVAHELGHSISWKHGWFQQHDCQFHQGQCDACELRAASYMAAWGFDAGVILPNQR